MSNTSFRLSVLPLFWNHPKVILCGGKSVGKSSLLRFLVNKCLYKWKQILVLDFDLGQCEFTLPGCISATVVEEPLLGPNFSHLKEPVRSVYLGEVDVTKCPEKYIEGCKSLIDFADENYSDIPWLVNTMGFTKGFGVSLACGIITYTSPTHVVQIQSKDRKLNFPSLLEPQYVECLRHSAFDVALSRTDYQLYEIPSGSEQPGFVSKSRGMSPAESRNLVILSYMSRMLNSNTSSLSQVTPYMINMDKLKLLTINEYNLTKSQVAATMNGNMVALCLETPSNKFLDCRGFGIVRAVDWQNNTLFLITPLPPSELSGVNCLVKGNIGLPDSLYYNQGELVTGHVPYLAHTSAGSTARFAKRDFRSLPVTQRSYR
ncbi:polynucleotide 5'-hydroxyl-kinase NOL9 [Macrosteles quadrilineatus]|uniref:polynucleotide 5'-hydroxyl-kinase NOL9 n=1 Tax=Macrosteles quadrilineatus TaxID=74068 RepID=UPI0023E1D4FB|nr:polynucleotide 5'-hydroxyl-kinase NOL9 [Macrosteles quadrilineatus]